MIIISVWALCVVACVCMASNKGKNVFLALIAGVIFGLFAVVYYACCRGSKGGLTEEERGILVLGREGYADKLRTEAAAKEARRPSVIRWRIGVAAVIGGFVLLNMTGIL